MKTMGNRCKRVCKMDKGYIEVLGASLLLTFFLCSEVSGTCKSFNFSIAVDDIFDMYVDGLPVTGLPNELNWGFKNTVKLSCTTRVIAVEAINLFAEGWIRGSDDEGLILTNSSWKCTNISYPGWEKVDFDDSYWPNAVVTGCGSFGKRAILNPNSQCIWTNDSFLDKIASESTSSIFAYCRKRLEVNECQLGPPENQCNPMMGQCIDTFTDYRCNCFQGYTNVGNHTCEEVKECALGLPENQCFPTMGQCIDTIIGYKCNCFKGYTNVDNHTCEAVSNDNEANGYIILGAVLGASILVIALVVVLLVVFQRRKAQKSCSDQNVGTDQPNATHSSGDDNSAFYEDITHAHTFLDIYNDYDKIN